MATIRTHYSSFAAGELTPELFGRMDLNKRQVGLALARNFIIQPHGPAQNRTGTRFVKAAGGSAYKPRLVPFSYSNQQTFAIEIGVDDAGLGYFRFHTQAATLQWDSADLALATAWNQDDFNSYYAGQLISYSGHCYVRAEGTSVTITNPASMPSRFRLQPADGTFELYSPYAASELFDIHYVQSADVLTLVHPNHPVRELRRYGVTDWRLTTVSFANTGVAPAGVTATPNAGTTLTAPSVSVGSPDHSGALSYRYWVTAVSGLNESAADNHNDSANVHRLDASSKTYYNDLSWPNTSGAVKYRIYRASWTPSFGGISPSIGELIAEVIATPSSSSFQDATLTSLNYFRDYGHPNTFLPGDFPVLADVGSGTPVEQKYVVTAVVGALRAETTASASASAFIDLTVTGQHVLVTWTNVSGASRYNVYKYSNGLYGYIGQSSDGAVGFLDDNITPDISQPPPENDTTLNNGAGTYPAAVGYFEQRRAFAGWDNSPQSLLATCSGTESSTVFHIPSQADDRLSLRIAAREASAIRHIVPVQDVLLLTASNEFRMYAADGNAISAANVTVKPQSYVGANNVQPCVVSNAVLYAAAWGGHLREMSYNWQAQSYLTGDVSLLAKHLFDYKQITDMAFTKAPTPILWCVNDQGQLLGMTYVAEQQISAWHQHSTTQGLFESCCSVAENGEEMLYLVVNRTLNGTTHRYIEVLASRNFGTPADAFFVDCGLTYSGAATTTLSGLDHLEGQTVNVLGDGAALPSCTVTGGSITLQHAVSKAQVGLPLTADLQTLPLVYQATDFGAGRVKNLSKAFLRVVTSLGLRVGPTFDDLTLVAQRTNEPYGTATATHTGELEVVLDNLWSWEGALCARHADPLPLTIVSVAVEAAVGG